MTRKNLSRNRILKALRASLPEPFVAAIDQSHVSKVVVRDPNDKSDRSKFGRWRVQVWQGMPIASLTVWHHPERMLDGADAESWIVAVDDKAERCGFRDEAELARYVCDELKEPR